MPDDHDQGVGGGDGGLASALLAETAVEAAELGADVGAGAPRGPGALSHVDPYFGDDDLGGAFTDPRDRGQQLDLRAEREAGLVDAGVQPGDHVGEVVDVFQVQGAHQRVLVTEAARARHPQLGDLSAHHPAGQIGQHGGVAFPGDQRRGRRSFLRLPGYQAGCGTSSALSSSAATASRSRWRVSTCPAVSRPCSRLRAVRTASRNVRARVRPASSGAVASRAVSRSSSADTWLDPTVQPPAAWSSDSARRSSGTRTRANHPTSSSAAARSARHARRRRARSRSGTATATATMTAASSHHNPPVASLVSAADPGAGGDGVGDGVGAASAGSVEGRFGG